MAIDPSLVWTKAIHAVKPFVVKIETPNGYGTGFLFAYNDSGALAAIVTALHVVQYADEWKQPFKIALDGGQSVFVQEGDRVLFLDAKRDTASIVIPSNLISFPKKVLPILASDKYRGQGCPVGWLGYPAVAPSKLCFFKGHTSAFEEDGDFYYVDGVAINGVSGGPVFDAEDPPTLLGTVSAYSPNYQRGATLPGLLMAHDLTHAHDMIARFNDMAAAREKKATEPAPQSPASRTPATPPSDPSSTPAPAAPPKSDGSNPVDGVPGPKGPKDSAERKV